jgi:hypothetical protein
LQFQRPSFNLERVALKVVAQAGLSGERTAAGVTTGKIAGASGEQPGKEVAGWLSRA